jgi:hypothetical protein
VLEILATFAGRDAATPSRCLVVLMLSYPVCGADFPIKASESSNTYNWTGFYAGAHLDYQAGQARWSDNRSDAAGVLNLGKGYDFSSGTGSYAIGFQGRYDYIDTSHHVFGVEGDILFPNTLSGKQTFSTLAAGSATPSLGGQRDVIRVNEQTEGSILGGISSSTTRSPS